MSFLILDVIACILLTSESDTTQCDWVVVIELGLKHGGSHVKVCVLKGLLPASLAVTSRIRLIIRASTSKARYSVPISDFTHFTPGNTK